MGGASTRQIVWGATAALALAVGGFGVTHREHAVPLRPRQPDIVYGQFDVLDGQEGLCTEYELADGAWRCDNFELPSPAWRFVRAVEFGGPCAHLKVDQTTGRWICLAAQPEGDPSGPGGSEGV